MIDPDEKNPAGEEPEQRDGLSWAAMMLIVLGAILVAAAFAYLLVRPFFPRHLP
jgi:hypothetical protein